MTRPGPTGNCYCVATPRSCDAGKKRLDDVFATDDPSQEIVAAWGVKEALRLMLSNNNPASVEDRKAFFERQVKAAAMKETDWLLATVIKW